MPYEKRVRSRLLSLAYGLLADSDDPQPTPLSDLIMRHIATGTLAEPILIAPDQPDYDPALGAALAALTKTDDRPGIDLNYRILPAPGTPRAQVDAFTAELDTIIDGLSRQKISPALGAWYTDVREGDVYRGALDRLPGVPIDLTPRQNGTPSLILVDESHRDIVRTGLENLAMDLRAACPQRLFPKMRDALMRIVKEQNGRYREAQVGDNVYLWTNKPVVRAALQAYVDEQRLLRLGPSAKSRLTQVVLRGFGRAYLEREQDRVRTLLGDDTLSPEVRARLEPAAQNISFHDEAHVRALIDAVDPDVIIGALRESEAEMALAKSARGVDVLRSVLIVELAQRICFDDAWEYTPNFLAQDQVERSKVLHERRGRKGAIEKPVTAQFVRQPPYNRVIAALSAMSTSELETMGENIDARAEKGRPKIMRAADSARRAVVDEMQQKMRVGKGQLLRGSLQRNLADVRRQAIDANLLVNAAMSENESIARKAFLGKTVRGERDAYADDLHAKEYQEMLAEDYLARATSMHDLQMRESIIRAIASQMQRDENGQLHLPRLVTLERQKQPRFFSELPGVFSPAPTREISGRPVAIFGLNKDSFVQRFTPYGPPDDLLQKDARWKAAPAHMQQPLLAMVELGDTRITPAQAHAIFETVSHYVGDSWLQEAITSVFAKRYREIVGAHTGDKDAAHAALTQEFGELLALFPEGLGDALAQRFELRQITSRYKIAREFGFFASGTLRSRDVRTASRDAIIDAFVAHYNERMKQSFDQGEMVAGADILLDEFSDFFDSLPVEQQSAMYRELQERMQRNVALGANDPLAYAIGETIRQRLHDADPQVALQTYESLPGAMRALPQRDPQAVRELFERFSPALQSGVARHALDILEEHNPRAARDLFQPSGHYALLDMAALSRGTIYTYTHDEYVVDRPVFKQEQTKVWGERDAFITYDYEALVNSLCQAIDAGLEISASLDERTQGVSMRLLNGMSVLKAEREIAEYREATKARDHLRAQGDEDHAYTQFLSAVERTLTQAGHGVYAFAYRADDGSIVWKPKTQTQEGYAEALAEAEHEPQWREEIAQDLGGEPSGEAHGEDEARAALEAFAAERDGTVSDPHGMLFDDARIARARKYALDLHNVVLHVRSPYALADQAFEGHAIYRDPAYTAILCRDADGREIVQTVPSDLVGPLQIGSYYRFFPEPDSEWVVAAMPARDSQHLKNTLGDAQRGIVTPERRSMLDLAISQTLARENAEHGTFEILDAPTITRMQERLGLGTYPLRVSAEAIMVDVERRFAVGYDENNHRLVPIFLDDLPSMITDGDRVTLDLYVQNGVVRTDSARIISRFGGRPSEWQEAMDLGTEVLSKQILAERLSVPAAHLHDFRPKQGAGFEMVPLLITRDRTYFGSERSDNHWDIFSVATYGPLLADPNELALEMNASGSEGSGLTDERRAQLVSDLVAFGHDPANGVQFQDLATWVEQRKELTQTLRAGRGQFILRGARLELRPVEGSDAREHIEGAIPGAREQEHTARWLAQQAIVSFAFGDTVGRTNFAPVEGDGAPVQFEAPVHYLGTTAHDVVVGLDESNGTGVKMRIVPIEREMILNPSDIETLRVGEQVRLQVDGDGYILEDPYDTQSRTAHLEQNRGPSA